MIAPFVSVGAMVMWGIALTPLPWWCFLLPSFLLWLYRAPGVSIIAKFDHGLGLDGAWIDGQWLLPGLGVIPNLRSFVPLGFGLLVWGWSSGEIRNRVRPEVVVGDLRDDTVGVEAPVFGSNISEVDSVVQVPPLSREEFGAVVVSGQSETSNVLEDECWSMDVWLDKRPFRRIP